MLLALALATVGHASSILPNVPMYVGIEHTEAVIEFDHEVQYDSQTTRASVAIEEQIRYLFGPMQFDAHFDRSIVPAAPKNDHEIFNIEIREVGTGSLRVATYTYSGTALVSSRAGNTLQIKLPVNPATLPMTGGDPCTDGHYRSAVDYWYYWSPLRPGCMLNEGTDYKTVQARVARRANTVRTYPEYERLKDSNGVIAISVFFGLADKRGAHHPERIKNGDLNTWAAQSYLMSRDQLLTGGYKRTARTGGEDPAYFFERFEKKKGGTTIRVAMYFGETGLNDLNVSGFHKLFKEAIETRSVILYHGHSGLGSNLHLPRLSMRLGEISLPKDRYQIIFFNGCTSYPYYASMYFNAKASRVDPKGTKNLDIVTNGMEGYFEAMGRLNRKFIYAIDHWVMTGNKLSYQDILENMRAQGDRVSFTGVNGDEDNPTSDMAR